MNAPALLIEPPTATPAVQTGRAFIGIDNGTSGAIACITPAGEVLCQPVLVQDLGREKLMDIAGNLALLRRMIATTGLPDRQVLVVFEQAQITPKFGYKNNYTNGRNNEFWRVLLSLAQIPFAWVNPRKWQNFLFADICSKDTKAIADVVRRQRLPDLDLDAYTTIQIVGINNAIGIALCARHNF